MRALSLARARACALWAAAGRWTDTAGLVRTAAVLIEANCRLHGGEGTWAPMAEACLGYSAVSAMIDSYLDPIAFAAIPKMPHTFRAHAMEAKVPPPDRGSGKPLGRAPCRRTRC